MFYPTVLTASPKAHNVVQFDELTMLPSQLPTLKGRADYSLGQVHTGKIINWLKGGFWCQVVFCKINCHLALHIRGDVFKYPTVCEFTPLLLDKSQHHLTIKNEKLFPDAFLLFDYKFRSGATVLVTPDLQQVDELTLTALGLSAHTPGSLLQSQNVR